MKGESFRTYWDAKMRKERVRVGHATEGQSSGRGWNGSGESSDLMDVFQFGFQISRLCYIKPIILIHTYKNR